MIPENRASQMEIWDSKVTNKVHVRKLAVTVGDWSLLPRPNSAEVY